MEIKNFVEGRRGYEDSDYKSIPRKTRYASEAEAVAAMSGNKVAFRLYLHEGRVSWVALATYHLVERQKPSKPWKSVGTCLASCDADANEQLGGEFGKLSRTVSGREWHAIQVKQHLKGL